MAKVDLRRQRESPAADELVTQLIARRRSLGWTQVRLAVEIGTSPRTVCQLEARAQDPKLSTVIVWAGALGLRLRWIEATQGDFG